MYLCIIFLYFQNPIKKYKFKKFILNKTFLTNFFNLIFNFIVKNIFILVLKNYYKKIFVFFVFKLYSLKTKLQLKKLNKLESIRYYSIETIPKYKVKMFFSQIKFF